MSRATVMVVILGAALWSATADAAPAQVAAPRVRAGVDRTALWIGDRIEYDVDIVCARGVDILLDDLAKEKLRLNGLEIVTADSSSTTDTSERTTHRFRYVLTTYRFDSAAPSIEPISVRYYASREGERLQDVAPAGEVQIPGAVLAFRSTLPENQPELAIRDGRSGEPRRAFYAHTSQIGLALVVLSLVPGLFVIGSALRRHTARQPARRSARRAKHDERATLERLRALDTASETDRRRACDEISAAVRAYVESRARVPATAMTGAEVDTALSARGGRLPRETVVSLLQTCDNARYRPTADVLSQQACREALSTAEQVLTGR